VSALPVMERAPMMREHLREEAQAVKDKSYRRSPVGEEVGRFLRARRWEGLAANSLSAYETVLARFAYRHADFEALSEFCSPLGTEYVREFLETEWGSAASATKAQRTAIVHSFFKWAAGERRIPYDPTTPIRAPKAHNRERLAYRRETRLQLVRGQDGLRDQCALQLLARLALRKNELRVLQVRDIDLTRNLVVVHGKGGRVDVLPLALPDLREDLYLHVTGEARRPEEYLLYPRSHRHRPMNPSSVHRWFKRCLQRADLPATIELHEMRHSAADELWRVTGNIVLAQKLLRHESVGTTQTYLHPTHEDLAEGLALVAAAWKDAE
jgi:site-specific recombinase XerD